jgi:23S rRNA pseudouridine955/2504/2580 synthase
MKKLSKENVTWDEVGEEDAGQRIDNYLIRRLKGVPKSHVYRILRSGEVRVNSGRKGPEYRVVAGDKVRFPPVRIAQRAPVPVAHAREVHLDILHEDDALLVINKPPGMAVHGGSGVKLGTIELLRQSRPHAPFLELVHRLDRDTSGVLMVAKKRAALVALHAQLRDGEVRKYYDVLVRGKWRDETRNVRVSLRKHVLKSGERRVSVAEDGMASHTIFRLKRKLAEFSVLEAELKTGRTHQIRVHLAHIGYPIAGDDKYGDFTLNKSLMKLGLKRMFLHAARVVIRHPLAGGSMIFMAPLPEELTSFINHMAVPPEQHAETL